MLFFLQEVATLLEDYLIQFGVYYRSVLRLLAALGQIGPMVCFRFIKMILEYYQKLFNITG
jgi:hypothetical protein